jgi:ATP-dependent helicase/nuclease subunit B
MRGTLARLLRHFGVEFAQSKFEPAAFEMPIELAGEVEPLRLETADGAPVIVEGIVDRVDVMRGKNGKTFVRVVDYKSGRKDFQLRDILSGLNLQMLFYLFTIGENGGERFGENIPAGVLYMPVREQFISAPRTVADSAVLSEHAKNWKMSGLLLEDEEVLRGMEADVAGVFIPAKLKKDGTLDGRSSLASLARMGKLAEAVKEQIIAMGEALHGGQIAAKPVEDVVYPACTYCDYRAVCGFEEGDPIREIAKLDREEVLRMLERGTE